MSRRSRLARWIALLAGCLLATAARGQTGARGIEYFETEVRPLLAERCTRCHGERRQKSNLRLDSGAAILTGGARGPAVVPGDPDASLLVAAVRYGDEDLAMPPKGKLDEEEIATLVEWVRRGAPHPTEATTRAEVEFDLEERSRHWAFQPLADPVPPPALAGTAPVDAFVRLRLAERGLEPAPEADARALLRRLSFDLTGLPPSPEAVRDCEPGRLERTVDELLAVPSFGERWARHWLDLMRYAESRGHEFDDDIPNAYQYRDYVIRAFNADLPYDRFVTEHLAGDLLDPPRLDSETGANESVLGTGFWFLGSEVHSPVDIRGDETDRTASKVDVVSKAFLGLTVACARCHDHKFDPISARDFYALSGFALGGSYRQVRFETMEHNARVAADLQALDARHAPELERALGAHLAGRAVHVSEHLAAATEVAFPRGAAAELDEAIPAHVDLLFEDFERADHAPWVATGTAFGPGPRARADLPDYQELTGQRGARLVNSHNTRGGEDSSAADAHVGTLTSPPFTLERDFIHFLISGGSHDTTEVRLQVEGQLVAATGGSDSNAMEPASFDVRAWRGRTARLVVIDEHSGSWGHIGLDHVVFSDRADASALEVDLPPALAARRARLVREQVRLRGLAPEAVIEWAEQLGRAVDAEEHPLHPYAFLAATTRGLAPLARARQHEYVLAARAARPGGEVRVLADFGPGGDTPWLQDGFGFGAGPRGAGELVPGATAVGFDVASEGAAHWDPTWDVLEVAEESERDPNAVDWEPSGRMLRTPTVTLEGGRIFYLVRGAGHAFAVIDTHRMVKGPLHARTTLTFDVAGDGFAWVEHDLREYAGHRMHVELSPRRRAGAQSDFAVALVVESPERPPARGRAALVALLEGAGATLPELAERYERAFRDAARRLREGELSGSPAAARDAALLAWLGRRTGSRPPAPAHYVAERAALTDRIVAVSHVAPAMLEGSGVDELLLVRGNHRTPGEVVRRRYLEVFDGPAPMPLEAGSGRLELARRLTDRDQPLLARVWVNRIWHHLFGRGIVASVDDFGHMGEAPADPELLDYLARRLIDQGWSTKAVIREVVLSETYRMASAVDPAVAELDPQNLLLQHAPRRRLQAEAIRDAILAVSGGLDAALYGAPVPVHLTEHVQGRGRPEVSGPLDGGGRRSLYLAVRRNFTTPFFRVFDFPPPAATMGRRDVSNVPAQALALMNDPFVLGEARRWAERITADPDRTPEQRATDMFRSALARDPDPEELDAALAFVEHRSWADLGHVLFNLKEFVFLD